MKQSQKLTDFYNAYNNWINNGAKDCYEFDRRSGLCHSLDRFSKFSKDPNWEMKAQFAQARLNTVYPFDKDNFDFEHNSHHYVMHLNLKRIQWVKDHLS